VIICNFNLFRSGTRPEETYPILLIDTDTVLALSLAFQRFQAIARRDAQVIQCFGGVKLIQLLGCDFPQRLRTSLSRSFRIDTVEDVFCS